VLSLFLFIYTSHSSFYPLSLHDALPIFLEELQVDRLYIITFDDALATLAPQAFIDHIIIGLNIKHLVAGFDFTYGPKDIANMSTIGKHSRGLFTYTMMEQIVWNDKKVSSTAIRSC